MGQAAADIGVGSGFLQSGRGFLQAANNDGSINSSYMQLASAELNTAAASLNEGLGNLRLVSSRMSLAQGGGLMERWGRDRVIEAERELRNLLGVRKSTQYSRK